MAPGTEEPAPDWAALVSAPEERGAPANADEGLAEHGLPKRSRPEGPESTKTTHGGGPKKPSHHLTKSVLIPSFGLVILRL